MKFEGIIKTITIKRDRCGDSWIYFSCDDVDDSEPKPKTGKSAGFDYGNKTFLTSDEGEKIDSPQFFKQSLSADTGAEVCEAWEEVCQDWTLDPDDKAV